MKFRKLLSHLNRILETPQVHMCNREWSKIKFDYISRDYNETMKIFDKHGCPSFISFDHDLGAKSKTGFV